MGSPYVSAPERRTTSPEERAQVTKWLELADVALEVHNQQKLRSPSRLALRADFGPSRTLLRDTNVLTTDAANPSHGV